MAFEYADVLSDSIEIAALDQFLTDADVNPLSQSVGQLLEADDIYVITSVIKSKKISVTAKRKDQSSVAVSVPAIKGIVGGNVNVSGNSDSTSEVTFEGEVPLVFGFQAVRLIYEDGRYTAFKPLAADGGALSLQPLENLSQGSQANHDFLVVDGGMVNI